jgi:hypothetical protein
VQEHTIGEQREIPERKVDASEILPARVTALELQIVHLRDEMRVEFSALRAEIRAVDEALRAEIRAGDEALRAEIRAGDEALRAEIRAGDEETRRFMRVLHEDVIGRIASINEGRRPRKKR